MTPKLLGVVSDRTGYPSEMLTMDMELESDLGIDSIKRVEILSAMQDLVPELPEVDLAVMAGLATLGEIVAYLTDQASGAASIAPTSRADKPQPTTRADNRAASVVIRRSSPGGRGRCSSKRLRSIRRTGTFAAAARLAASRVA